MDPKRAPELIKDFIKTMEPLQIEAELLFYKSDGTEPFLSVERMKGGMVCYDHEKDDFINEKQIDKLDFSGTKLKIVYFVLAEFAPSEFHTIQESIPYNQDYLRQSIKELDVLKSWLDWWKL